MTLLQLLIGLVAWAVIVAIVVVFFLRDPARSVVLGIGLIFLVSVVTVAVLVAIDHLRNHR